MNREHEQRSRIEEITGYHVLVRGRHGLFLANQNDIYIGQALVAYGEFSEQEWQALRTFCKQDRMVAEIGANIGAHTVNIAKSVGQQGRVMAIEPQPVIFQNRCANLALNCLTHVDAQHCGCGAVPGTVRIPPYNYSVPGNFGGISLTPSDNGTPVRIVPFDDLLDGSHLDLIKIDVEGMEQEVILGAREAIQEFRPILYVENDRIEKSRALSELIQGLDYRLWWHLPRLYNSDNFFGNQTNIYGKVVSLNMICVPREAPLKVQGFREGTDSGSHPLNPAGARDE